MFLGLTGANKDLYFFFIQKKIFNKRQKLLFSY